MPSRDVAVTGLGLVTPAGIGVESTWSTVLSGRSTTTLDPVLAGNPVQISCRVPGFDPAAHLGARRAHRLDPFVQYAIVATREALTDARLSPGEWESARVGVVLGCALGGTATFEKEHRSHLDHGPERVSPLVLPMHLSNMLSGQIGIEFGARGPNLVVSTACASATTAIGLARDLLLLDRCDVVITGGSEACLTPLVMAGFAQMGALSRRNHDPASASRPFDEDRDGFVGGEGAGILVLERTRDAAARRVPVRARVVGYGASADAHHMTASHPEGRGIRAALGSALADADAAPREIDHVNAHGTSTPMNDAIEAAALSSMLPHRPWVTSTKGVTGHLFGAAGGVEAALTILTMVHGEVPPTANLARLDPAVDLAVPQKATPAQVRLAVSTSVGFGGQNAALVLASG
ncbi:3-oxoacyl-[acyl-carrier-protein] synthase II [Streptomyces sp. SAI-170]|uniref:beta-ketoacyl-[acyl-carrier-protein] synthase family protein n=1 Tax=Streptomyces sp. SAI-170 TaxID=3377729 RepID=UPI003C7AF90E